MVESALSLSHTSFCRLLCDRFIWENPNPNLAFTAEETSNRDTARFDLLRCDPGTIEGLHPKISKLDKTAAFG
jgi:hypothetical protein